MDYWVLDGSTYRKSFELTVAPGEQVDTSDFAAMPTTAAFDPVIWYATFRVSAEYATFLAGVCPELPPSQSSIFAFCTRTFGAAMQFSNFNLPIGPQCLASFNDYLNYHFPALVSQVEALDFGPQTSRLAIMNAVTQLIQPGRAPYVWGE
ncbi:MAG: hypothetical protein WC455_18310 [Dehalococcoidia bacterium]